MWKAIVANVGAMLVAVATAWPTGALAQQRSEQDTCNALGDKVCVLRNICVVNGGTAIIKALVSTSGRADEWSPSLTSGMQHCKTAWVANGNGSAIGVFRVQYLKSDGSWNDLFDNAPFASVSMAPFPTSNFVKVNGVTYTGATAKNSPYTWKYTVRGGNIPNLNLCDRYAPDYKCTWSAS